MSMDKVAAVFRNVAAVLLQPSPAWLVFQVTLEEAVCGALGPLANVKEVELEPSYCSSIPLLYCSVSIKLRTIVKNSHN